MSPSRELYELQEKEIQVRQYRDSLQRITKDLEGSREMASAKANVQKLQSHLQTLKTEQQDIELVVSSLETRIQDIDRKLYSGSTSNSKELISFQDDSKMLNRQKNQEEEKLLDIMGLVEESEVRYQAELSRFQNAEKEWTLEEKRLSDESNQIGELVTTLESETVKIIETMVGEELQLFRTLQSSKGTAVAKVEQGICRGCGVTLPSGEVQKIRGATSLIRCPGCRRILIAG